MVGSLLFGWISDKWGRRPALLLSTAVMVIGNLVELSTPNYMVYIAIRFIVGLIHPSVYSLAFLIGGYALNSKRFMEFAQLNSIPFI